MLVSEDADLIARARYLATQARQPVLHYEHVDVGFNYRLSNLLAAVGRGQLEGLDAKVDRRRELRGATPPRWSRWASTCFKTRQGAEGTPG